MITHIVQAMAGGIGWADCRKATSFEDAQRQEAKLLANDSAWMEGERKTRIVPVEQSNCAPAYEAEARRLAAFDALLDMKGALYFNDSSSGFWVVSSGFGTSHSIFVHNDDPSVDILEFYRRWKTGKAERQREKELDCETRRYCGAA